MDSETETYSPAVERAAELLIQAETTGLIHDDARDALAAALDVEEMARVIFKSRWPRLDYDKGVSTGHQQSALRDATALRAAILGGAV